MKIPSVPVVLGVLTTVAYKVLLTSYAIPLFDLTSVVGDKTSDGMSARSASDEDRDAQFTAAATAPPNRKSARFEPQAARDNSGKSETEDVTHPPAGNLSRSDTAVDRLAEQGEPYLLRGFVGRLGNILFQLASAFCIAKLNRLTLVAQNVPGLADLNHSGVILKPGEFETLLQRLRVGSLYHPEPFCCGFQPAAMKLEPRNRSHVMAGFRQSWKYFEPCKGRVKRLVRFKDDVVTEAAGVVRRLKETYPGKALVGIHVRQEDYFSAGSLRFGRKVAPPDYYVRAMAYFRDKFRDVMFIAIVSDLRSGVINATSDVVFLPRSPSASVDMEVHSRLDHFIMSVGSFGWWAAYRSRGTVVCYKDFYVPGSGYGRQIPNNASDYLYPKWIAM